MSHRAPIRDIVAGSTWNNRDGTSIVVHDTAERYVQFTDALGARFLVPEGEFRARFTPIYDRQGLRSQFQMSIANLDRFHVYWIADEGRILARSIGCRRQFQIPAGAKLVGLYSHPCTPEAFFDDLDELIRLAAGPADPVRASA